MLSQLHDGDVYLSYLPLAHIFDRVMEETFLSYGASIGFWRGVISSSDLTHSYGTNCLMYTLEYGLTPEMR